MNDHNISTSKRKILDDIEKLVIQEEGKKRKIGRHEYILLTAIVYLILFPLFFLSFLIPLVGMLIVFIFYYKADKNSKKYQFEHTFWDKMFKEQHGV